MPQPTINASQIDWTAISLASFKELLRLLLQLWQFWLVLGILVAIRIGLWVWPYQHLAKAGMLDIDKMTWSEFEERLAILFSHLGYAVERTGKIGDYGVDLLLRKMAFELPSRQNATAGKVHPDAVQQVYAGKNKYRCTEALVVANRNFTTGAWRMARINNVKLWSRNYLVKVLLTEKRGQHRRRHCSDFRVWQIDRDYKRLMGIAVVREQVRVVLETARRHSDQISEDSYASRIEAQNTVTFLTRFNQRIAKAAPGRVVDLRQTIDDYGS